MIIDYKNKRVKEYCENLKKANRLFGIQVAKKLLMVINFIEESNVFNDLYTHPEYRLHKLYGDKNNIFSVVLGAKTGFRLLLSPLQENGDFYPDISDLTSVNMNTKRVFILEVTNHYE